LNRRVAIDWMRGFVMVLMAVDHASEMFNGARIAGDSAYIAGLGGTGAPRRPMGVPLPIDQFFTRWITHLCAPTFLFLTGTALAMSTESRQAAGDSQRSIDRHLAIRAGVLLAIEFGVFSLGGGMLVMQVLFAIAFGMLAMIALRRFPAGWLVAIAGTWIVGGEALCSLIAIPGDRIPFALSVLFLPAAFEHAFVLYPAVPWLAMMMLGWAFGCWLRSGQNDPGTTQKNWTPAQFSATAGLFALGIFAAVRSTNAYGNMFLLRGTDSIAQWLHVSKYPPSLSFVSLELGLMGIALALCFALEARLRREPRRNNPILVYGQTALFFYVLHLVLLGGVAQGLGILKSLGLGAAFAGALAVLIALYPACLWYRRYKAEHPRGWAQYV
jgi:uncharacterized membrane protein